MGRRGAGGRKCVTPACVFLSFSFAPTLSRVLSSTLSPGLYYPPGSLKSRFCVQGAAALYAYCSARNVPHARTGKLVVAVGEDEVPALDALETNAREAGSVGLERLTPRQALAAEPALTPSLAGALLSPNTGIVDSHGLMTAILADVEAGSGVFTPRTAVVAGEVGAVGGGARLDIRTPAPATITARSVVIAAGLGTHTLMRRFDGVDAGFALPPLFAAKGSYFRLAAPTPPPFSRLIYPLPPASGGGLGVHLTLDLGGQARFGPDVEWMETGGGGGPDEQADVLGPPGTADPAPSPARAAAFVSAIRRWWPGLPPGAALLPDYAGVRPKLVGPGDPLGDFFVEEAAPGVVVLAGIESPGLTASLLLGEAAAASACGDESWRSGGVLDVGL